MKILRITLLTVFLALALRLTASDQEGDFVSFLTKEIASIGGKTNGLSSAKPLMGKWVVNRDQLGAAIDTKGISFESITNWLTGVCGQPKYYIDANERHGPTYVYPSTNVTRIVIYVGSTKSGAEVTIHKPIKAPP